MCALFFCLFFKMCLLLSRVNDLIKWENLGSLDFCDFRRKLKL